MAGENPFKGYKPEILPHPVEVAISYAERAIKFGRSLIFNTNVPLSASSHYVREHFTQEPVQPPQGLPPAQKWEA